MMKADIIFGSQSDEKVYKKIQEDLEGAGFETEVLVLSAHRQPEELKEHLETKERDILVAGAGLAAHLPGVCASLWKGPVFGVPVRGNFSGLDSFLSIVQMPKGVPVACLWQENILEIPKLLEYVEKNQEAILSANLNEHLERDFDGLRVPLIEGDEKQDPQMALKFFEISQKKGIWLGANRKENAEIFLNQLRGIL